MKDTVCLDSGFLLAWLMPEKYSEAAGAAILKWKKDRSRLMTAPLFHAEVTSVIREQVYFKKLLPEQGDACFFYYQQLGVESYTNEIRLQQTAWELAKSLNLPRAYDAQYLAAAELENCELWTADKRLYNSISGKNKRIRWVGELA